MKTGVPVLVTFGLAGILFLNSCGGSRLKEKDAVLFEKGKNSYSHRDFRKAEEYFSAVAASSRSFYPAYLMLGKSYYYAGENDKAVKVFKTMLHRERGSVSALNWLARIEGIDKGDKKRGLEYCERALSLDPENTMARFYKAMILEDMSRIKEAIAEYSQALESSHLIRLAHYKLGLLFENRGVHDRANLEFKEALKYGDMDELATDIKKHLQIH